MVLFIWDNQFVLSRNMVINAYNTSIMAREFHIAHEPRTDCKDESCENVNNSSQY